MTSQTALAWTLHVFEKDKGGVGSTGSLVTAAHSVMLRGDPVVFVEASPGQNDLLIPYGGHHAVTQVDLVQADARDRILDAVVAAPPGAAIFVNVPANRLDELQRVHELIHFIMEDDPDFPLDVVITWTMGLDPASRETLDGLLASSPPGRLLLNLPTWHGEPDGFKNVDAALLSAIAEAGGGTFRMPRLDAHLYDLFRKDSIAIDRIATTPGLSIGNRMAFKMWERDIARTLGGFY